MSDASVMPSDEHHYRRAFSDVTIWAACAFAAFLGFSRLSYGLLLPAIRATFPTSYGAIGLVGSANLGGYLLGTLLLPFIAARVPSRLWLNTGALLAMNAGMVAAALSANLLQLALWRGIIGVASAWVAILTLALTLGEVAPAQRGQAAGIIWAGGALGLIISGMIAPVVIGAPSPLGWRVVWLGMGLVGCVAAVGLHRTLRRGTIPPPPRATGALRLGVLALGRPAGMLLLPLAYLLFGVGHIIYFTYFIALIVQAGVPGTGVGVVWALIGVAGCVGGLLWGRALDRWPTGYTLALALGLGALGAATVALGTIVGAALGAAMMGAAFIGTPALFTGMLRRTVAPNLYTDSLSLLTAAVALGQAVAPVVGGVLIDKVGLQTGTALAALPLALGGVLAAGFGWWRARAAMRA
ncbi:MAG: YbfB/YjiJ family MFS transporter [Ktedonobacterales bacterium]|nr:YbfB/YjiJ family MFS transporter [Ktedonobacterales bacterium]